MNLVLYSVFNKDAITNFENNVVNGINKEELIQILNDKDYKIINQENKDKIYFWGCKNTRYYAYKIEKFKKGDNILFAENKQFHYVAEIQGVLKNEKLGDYLFKDSIYSNIIILDNIRDIDITYNDLFNELGYNTKLKINGLFLVSQDKSNNFFKKYKDLNNYLKNIRSLKTKVL